MTGDETDPVPRGKKRGGGGDRPSKKSRREDPVDESSEESEEEDDLDDFDVPEQDPTELRNVRMGYRGLIDDMEVKPPASAQEAMNILASADEAFKQVFRTNEAILDAKVLNVVSRNMTKTARNTNIKATAFDTTEFVELVKIKGAGGEDDELDWKALGRLAMRFSRKVPTMDFMFGPLSVEAKVRKKSEKKVQQRSKEPVVQPAQLSKEDAKKDENQVPTLVRRVFDSLKAATSRPTRGGQTEFRPISFFEFVTNPDPERGFSQTVENLFYLAFLIKDNRVALAIDAEGMPVLTVVNADENLNIDDGENPVAPAAKANEWQHLMDWSMLMWRDVIKAFNVTRSHIPTRPAVAEAGIVSHSEAVERAARAEASQAGGATQAQSQVAGRAGKGGRPRGPRADVVEARAGGPSR